MVYKGAEKVFTAQPHLYYIHDGLSRISLHHQTSTQVSMFEYIQYSLFYNASVFAKVALLFRERVGRNRKK